MVRIPRCGCLTSYKKGKRYLVDQVEIAGLFFFIGKLQKGLNSCRNDEVLCWSYKSIGKHLRNWQNDYIKQRTDNASS